MLVRLGIPPVSCEQRGCLPRGALRTPSHQNVCPRADLRRWTTRSSGARERSSPRRPRETPRPCSAPAATADVRGPPTWTTRWASEARVRGCQAWSFDVKQLTGAGCWCQPLGKIGRLRLPSFPLRFDFARTDIWMAKHRDPHVTTMSKMTVIVAASRSWGIGSAGQIPWRLSKVRRRPLSRRLARAPLARGTECGAWLAMRRTWRTSAT